MSLNRAMPAGDSAGWMKAFLKNSPEDVVCVKKPTGSSAHVRICFAFICARICATRSAAVPTVSLVSMVSIGILCLYCLACWLSRCRRRRADAVLTVGVRVGLELPEPERKDIMWQERDWLRGQRGDSDYEYKVQGHGECSTTPFGRATDLSAN